MKHAFGGYYESVAGKMSDPQLDPELLAGVGQMLYTPSSLIRYTEAGDLELPYRPLSKITIGGLRLYEDTESDLRQFLHQPCVSGSSATLVSPRHVLTAAHSVIVERLVHHVFVFGRTHDDTEVHVDPERGIMTVPKARLHYAHRLVAYVRTDSLDWALIELDDPVEDIEPLGVGRWRPAKPAHLVGHPLGLPLKQCDVRPEKVQVASPRYQLDADVGSGASGSPLIQAGSVVGVLSGHVGVDSAMEVRSQGHRYIDPALSQVKLKQPFTPAAFFSTAVPEILGW